MYGKLALPHLGQAEQVVLPNEGHLLASGTPVVHRLGGAPHPGGGQRKGTLAGSCLEAKKVGSDSAIYNKISVGGIL